MNLYKLKNKFFRDRKKTSDLASFFITMVFMYRNVFIKIARFRNFFLICCYICEFHSLLHALIITRDSTFVNVHAYAET